MFGGKKEKDPSAIGMPRGEMASGKGDFSKVRKSLAWNKAFSTEEGVLDSMELSLLNGSVSMPDESLLSRNHDVSTTSPFTSSKKIRSNTSRLQPIRETPGMGTQTRRTNIDRNPNSLFFDSNSVARGRPPIHRKQEKAPEEKNSCQNILWPPVANSQKRIANASVSTTTSKIPKHKGQNLSVPKPLKNSPQSSKTSKTGQTIPTINDHRNKQSVGARSTRLSENRKPSSSIQSMPNKSAKIKVGQTPLNNILQTRTNSDLTLHPKPPRPGNSTPFCEVTQNHKFITPSSVIEDNSQQAPPVKSLAMPLALRKPSPSLDFFQGRKTPLDVGKARTTQDALSSVSGKTFGCTKEIITTDTSNSSSTKLNMNCAIKSNTESCLLKRTMVHNSSAAKNSKIRIENSEKLLVAEHINKQDKEKNFGLLDSTDSKKIGTKLHQQHILKPKSSSESNISGEEKCSVEQIDSFSQACYENNTVDVGHFQSNDSNCNITVNEVSTSSSQDEPDHEVLIGNDYSDDQTNKLVQGLSLSKPIINIKNIDSVKNEYTEPVHLDALSSVSGKTLGCTKEIITTDTSNSSSTKLNMNCAIKSSTESCLLKRTMVHNSSAAKNSKIRIENSEKLLVAEHINKQDKEKNFGLLDSTDSKKIGTKLHQQHILKPKSSSESNISGEEKCSVEQIDSFSQACYENNTVDVGHFQSNDSNCNITVNEVSTSSSRNEPDHEVLIGNDYSEDQTNKLVQGLSLSKPIINIKNIDSVKNEYAEPVHLDDVQTKNNISKRKCAALDPEPFTDEWIAAREAFGEDILTKKGGAVQNSPTEKILPEPSPWSPVKRKNQDVGPYDCTKYTKCI